jgi:hypothetical protein
VEAVMVVQGALVESLPSVLEAPFATVAVAVVVMKTHQEVPVV